MSRRPPLSLQKTLYMLIFTCWVLPLMLTLAWFATEQSATSRVRTEEAVTTSANHAIIELQRRLEDALSACRKVSYDKQIDDAFRTYLENGDEVNLYGKTSSYLSSQFSTNTLFSGALVLFWDIDAMQVCTIRSGINNKNQSTKVFIDAGRNVLLPAAEDLGTEILFQEVDGNLYLIRNLVDSRFNPYATLILPFDTEYLLEGGASILWATDAAFSIGDIFLPVLGEPAPLDNYELTYEGESDRFSMGVESDLEHYPLHLQLTAENDLAASERQGIYYTLGMIVLRSGILLSFMVRFVESNISKPLDTLLTASNRLAHGDLGYQIEALPSGIEFYQLTTAFNDLSTQLAEQFERHTQEQQDLHEAKIKALQSQMNPHFLNNTLEMINWQARMTGDETVCQMISSLAVMLNAAMARDGGSTITLAEEFTYIEAYLYIIGQRFGSRLQVQMDIDDTLWDAIVPRLILHPIVENAVEHGIALRRSGEVLLRIFCEDAMLVVEVEHAGVIAPEDREKIDYLLSWDSSTADKRISGRIGIRNVQHRLKMLCGEESGLTIEEYTPGRVLSRMVLPLRTTTNRDDA